MIDASGAERDIAAAIAARVRALLPAEVDADPAADLPGHGSAPLTEDVPAPPPASALGEQEPTTVDRQRWQRRSDARPANATAARADRPADNADLHR